jgi:nicotinate-nucleotide adenylyltransferase
VETRLDLPPVPGTRIGILGGTFDPVHRGHLLVAHAAFARLALDTLLFIPAHRNPLKQQQAATAFQHRLAMLDLAVAGEPGFFVSAMEGKRTPPSYTIDTIRDLRQRLGAQSELFFLVGMDAFQEVEGWKGSEILVRLVNLVVFPRPPYGLEELSAVMQRAFPAYHYDEGMHVWLATAGIGRVIPLELPALDLSATAIRTQVREGADPRAFVPPGVAEYIAAHRLYRAGPP